jgi:hypothetical protein
MIGKFVSFELMVKDFKHIVNLEQHAISTPEVQPVAFKAMEEKKEEPTPTNRLPINASKLDNEEMALMIKSFRQILKQTKGKEYKPHSKRVCDRCGKSGHYIAKCPYQVKETGTTIRKGRRRLKRKPTTTRRKVVRRTWEGSGTLTTAPLTPPSTRTLPTSPSTKVFYSPMSAISVSWPRRAKRRYTLEIPQIYYF